MRRSWRDTHPHTPMPSSLQLRKPASTTASQWQWRPGWSETPTLEGMSDNGSHQVLLPTLASFIQLVLEGRTPTSIRRFFLGANLTALLKKQGGVRPIAVGCTLRRLAAKVAGAKVSEAMGDLLAPRQLRYDVRKGTALLKLDFSNAFNSICRDKVLEFWNMPLSFTLSFTQSTLHHLPCSGVTRSAEGVQQGNPLGPLLFCLGIHHTSTPLVSELSLFYMYLDDSTPGGSVDDLKHDLEVVEYEGDRITFEQA